MSTRDERRDWQRFREEHGSNLVEFRAKWVGMFGRGPTADECAEYLNKRADLLAPLGRQAERAHAREPHKGSSPHDLNVRVKTLKLTEPERAAVSEAVRYYLERWPNEETHADLTSAHQKIKEQA